MARRQSRGVYHRMRFDALFAVVHGVIVLAALGGLAGPDPGLVVLVAALPLFFAWGRFHADVTLNPSLDEASRRWWRIALWGLPWSMAVYWHRHVRPRG